MKKSIALLIALMLLIPAAFAASPSIDVSDVPKTVIYDAASITAEDIYGSVVVEPVNPKDSSIIVNPSIEIKETIAAKEPMGAKADTVPKGASGAKDTSGAKEIQGAAGGRESAQAPASAPAAAPTVTTSPTPMFVLLVAEPEKREYSALLLEEIQQFLADGNELIQYFPEDVRQLIAEQLVGGGRLEDLEMNEMAALETNNAAEVAKALDQVRVKITFHTVYAQEQTIYPVLRIEKANGEVLWTLAKAEATQDGSVLLILTREQLSAFVDSPSIVLFVLSTPMQ